MKTTDCIKTRTCPKCGAEYIGVPALSRIPELGCICPDCGCREALESIGISKEEQEKIIHSNSRKQGEEK